MKMNKIIITKTTSKYIMWMSIGILYVPFYLMFWALRVFARLLLSIAYAGTLEGEAATRVFKSIFSFNYERTF